MVIRILRSSFYVIITALLYWVYTHKTGPLPPLGLFFSPFEGFWQNAENTSSKPLDALKISGLKGTATVTYDDRLVPHIFAESDEDLYYLQGFVTASHRLWQMDMQVRVAEGRLSEIIGEKILQKDIEARRIGLKLGAQRSLALMNRDPKSKMIADRYAAGVNAFIRTLKPKDYPLEYKLLDFKPEAWTPFKTALLLKYMANMLTGYENDFENTNAVKLLGYQTFNQLFPNFPDSLLDPVIPIGTIFPLPSILPDSQHVSFVPSSNELTAVHYPFDRPEPDLGSNNWAVSGAKTASGKPILCNDPHLGLNLPSIWFEIQLHTPSMNVYGASIPGAPCVISGFNENIAWGITNAAMDVKDWYTIEFRDSKRAEYRYDGNWKKSESVVERFYVRSGDVVYDTIIHTLHGPVAFDKKFNKGIETENRALRWTAHDPSNELLTFYKLNSSANYDEYVSAISHYRCPGQNFVFASATGDIAIWQQGKFVNRIPEQGRFVMDGSTSTTQWRGFIPQQHNPHTLNPERGWVSSANQHPTDETYPYYFTGIYEYFRNRRINQRLGELTKSKTMVKMQDMMELQNDNFNLYASEILPLMLSLLNPNEIRSNERFALTELKGWNYVNAPDLLAPPYFETWWKLLNASIWDEFENDKRLLTAPGFFHTIRYVKRFPDGEMIDSKTTKETESLSMLADRTFHDAVTFVENWQKEHPKSEATWANFKHTTVTHLSQQMAFSVENVQNGGNSGIINATSEKRGASWRMVVSPGTAGEAFGIYPGGQSGNPGSKFYASFIDDWGKGKYYNLLLLKPNEQHSRILYIQRCAP
jgi:penicillin amidase